MQRSANAPARMLTAAIANIFFGSSLATSWTSVLDPFQHANPGSGDGGEGGRGGDKGGTIREWSSLIGIVTAIDGNILISFALNIQRYAHVRIEREWERQRSEWKRDLATSQATLRLSSSNYGTLANADGQAGDQRDGIQNEINGANRGRANGR